jgi:hypothetical protein
VASVRKLPATRTAPAPVHPRSPESQPVAIATPVVVPSPPRSEVAALAPERYKVQFTVGRETYEKLRRVQDLLRQRVPNGDPAVIFDRAITLLLEVLEKKKIALTDRPRPSVPADKHSRRVPAEVRRTVWARDDGRCKFRTTWALQRNGTSRIPPRRAVRSRWRHHGRQPGAPLRCAQSLRGGAVLRTGISDVCERGAGTRNLEWRSSWSGSGMSATEALDYPDLVLSGYPDQDARSAAIGRRCG